MADAFKCDRCGSLFEGSPFRFYPEFWNRFDSLDDTILVTCDVNFYLRKNKHLTKDVSPQICRNCSLELLEHALSTVRREVKNA